MTAALAVQQTAARLGLAGGALGVLAGGAQAVAGTAIPEWTGDKADPVALGLLTILLSVIALGAASVLRRTQAPTPALQAVVAAGLVVPGALCISTVGRLWYLPGCLLLLAAGLALAAGGARDVWTVIRTNWTRVLVSLLGAFVLLMAVSAGPVSTIVVGAVGGVALMAAPWVIGQTRALGVVLLLIGTLPFALLTWWSVVTPLLAVLALAIGVTVIRSTDAVPTGRTVTGR